MSEKVKLTEFTVPPDHAEMIMGRISPLVYKHYQSMSYTVTFPRSPIKPFGMTELLISVYTQGLSDGVQVAKFVGNE